MPARMTMRIARNDVVRLCFQGAGNKYIVIRIFGNAIDLVQPFDNKGPFDNQGDKGIDIFF
jgi:hypothetical protein